MIVAEGLELKCVGSRIRSHPTDGIFQRGADQAQTDETRRQGVHRGVFRGRIAADFAPDLEAPITPNDQKTFQARNRLCFDDSGVMVVARPGWHYMTEEDGIEDVERLIDQSL